jgi:hypothetical protein
VPLPDHARIASVVFDDTSPFSALDHDVVQGAGTNAVPESTSARSDHEDGEIHGMT